MAAIDRKLKVDPRQYGERLGPPLVGLFKLKTSHVRIAYHVEESTREVWVLMLGDRRDIWRNRQGDIRERLERVRARVAREAVRRREDEAARARRRDRE